MFLVIANLSLDILIKRGSYLKECTLSRYYFQSNKLMFVQFTYVICFFFFWQLHFFHFTKHWKMWHMCYEVHNTMPLAFSYISNAYREAQLSDLGNHNIAIKQTIADKISFYLFVTIYCVCFFHVQFKELILADYILHLNSSTSP